MLKTQISEKKVIRPVKKVLASFFTLYWVWQTLENNLEVFTIFFANFRAIF